MNPLFASLPTTIFEHMSARARATGAINLGQGFPDGPGPADVIEAAAAALKEKSNQYPPMPGLAELRQAIAAHYAAHQQLSLDWQKEVTVTSGATEALAAAILGIVRPGDEVILFQPAYDSYAPMVRLAGGVVRYVTLQPPDWLITEEAIAAATSPRTRVMILNNPLNPTGTMLDRETIRLLAGWCARHDIIAICDEVWEHVVFDDRSHLSLIAEPEMRNRAVKIGSAGKIFALTGWKVGWLCAAPELSAVIARVHQFLTFTTPPNLQWAAAYGLGKEMGYFTGMRADLARSRDRLAGGLRQAGYAVLPSAGTYFLSIGLSASGIAMDDLAFCEHIVDHHGVAAIPVSAFYAGSPVTDVVRLCFAKGDAILDEAIARLGEARKSLS
jgi:aspartate/methionine/tyrosine aminotransferase